MDNIKNCNEIIERSGEVRVGALKRGGLVDEIKIAMNKQQLKFGSEFIIPFLLLYIVSVCGTDRGGYFHQEAHNVWLSFAMSAAIDDYCLNPLIA